MIQNISKPSTDLTGMKTMSISLVQVTFNSFPLIYRATPISNAFFQRDLRSVGILYKISPTKGVGSANSTCTYK